MSNIKNKSKDLKTLFTRLEETEMLVIELRSLHGLKIGQHPPGYGETRNFNRLLCLRDELRLEIGERMNSSVTVDTTPKPRSYEGD